MSTTTTIVNQTDEVMAAEVATVIRAQGVKKAPTPTEWELQRARITDLYEKSHLKDVMKIMKEQHDFNATEKMYKAKIEVWKITKKLRKQDYLAALGRIKTLGDRKPPIQINVGDRVVPLEKLKRFCIKNKIDFPGTKSTAQTVADLPKERALIRKPTTVPAFLAGPGSVEAPAKLFRSFERYVKGMFDNGTWKSHGTDVEIENSIFATKDLMLVEEQYDILWISKAFQEERRKADVLFCWNKLFANMEILLRSTYPTVLRRLIIFIEYFHKLELPELANKLQNHLPQLASAILGANDPRRPMFEALAMVNPDLRTMQYCYENIARLFADILEERLGADSTVAYRRRLDYIRNSERTTPSASLDTRLPNLPTIDRAYGPFSDVAMGLLSTRLQLHYHRKEHDAVLECAPQLIFRTEHAPRDNYRAVRFHIQAHIYLGLALYNLRHFEDARVRFKRALEENARPQAYHGGHECFYETHRCMKMLGDIARALNEPTAAALWDTNCAESSRRFLKTVIKNGDEDEAPAIGTKMLLGHHHDGGECGGEGLIPPAVRLAWSMQTPGDGCCGAESHFDSPRIRHSLTF